LGEKIMEVIKTKCKNCGEKFSLHDNELLAAFGQKFPVTCPHCETKQLIKAIILKEIQKQKVYDYANTNGG
jgi:DNA-directed RNA polymerase subunit RPC12/RpoP